MHEEKCNLKWDTYSDHLREMLHEMMKSNELTDVTLVCDDKRQFKAHKIVLSACSSVFKSIISDLPLNNSVIYLRGIQYQEVESILEFMYLGVATFHQERINEFLNVAKNLEIKEIGVTEQLKMNENIRNGGPDFPEYFEFHNENESKEEPEIVRNENTGNNGNENISYEAPKNIEDFNHKEPENIESEYQSLKQVCNLCEYYASCQSDLKSHIERKHEDMKYICNQCDQQFTFRIDLKRHIRTKHNGARYDCNQCGYQTKYQTHLGRHILSIHEGTKFPCTKCNYQASRKDALKSHNQNKHKRCA